MTWKRKEVRSTTRSAIARSKVRDWDDGTWKLRQDLTPRALERGIRYRVEDVAYFNHSAEIIYVPVRQAITVQMTPYTRSQPTCSARAADIEVMPNQQVLLPQTSNDECLRT